MSTTWVVVANRRGAKIYQNTAPKRPLTFVKEWDHPEGRLKNQELETDRAGGVADTSGVGLKYLTKEESATERVAELFTKDISRYLDEERGTNRFDHVILVAAPAFLGLLKESLSAEVKKKLMAVVDKDYYSVRPEQLAESISQQLEEVYFKDFK